MCHLNSLEIRLSNERNRHHMAATKKEKELRSVWIKQIESEIEREKGFVGAQENEMSDDELLSEIMA